MERLSVILHVATAFWQSCRSLCARIIRGTSVMLALESSQDSKVTLGTSIHTESRARVATSSVCCQDTIIYSEDTRKYPEVRRGDKLNSDPFFLSFKVDSFVGQHSHLCESDIVVPSRLYSAMAHDSNTTQNPALSPSLQASMPEHT